MATNKKRNYNHWHKTHTLTDKEVFLQYKVHTSSYFIRKECKDWSGKKYWFGDYVVRTWAFYRGQVVSLPKVMSVHNYNNPDGVMASIYNKQADINRKEMEKYLNEFSIKTNHKYDEIVNKKYQSIDFYYLEIECNDIISHASSKLERVNATKRMILHEYYREYISEKKGIGRLLRRYRYEGYFFYPLWKFVMRNYLKN